MTKFKLPLIVYDDKCTLCVRFKLALEKIPGTEVYQKVPLSSEDIFKAYPQLDKEACHKEMHLIDSEQNIYRGSEAIKILITCFPAIGKFSWLVESKMGNKAIDYFYKMSNKYRDNLIKKCNNCR